MLSQENLLKDGKLHIFLLGTGAPISNNKRVTSSIAIIANGEFILIDIGPGTYRNASLLRLPVNQISAVFLTHFHSDHIGDLGEVNLWTWLSGRAKPLEVYGPEGVSKVVNGFKIAYELDKEYRISHHGEDILPPNAGQLSSKPILINDSNARELCYDRNGLRVYAFEVDHTPVKPVYGYRIEYNNLIIVITGDTIKTENLVKHSNNADILFSDAISYELFNNLANVLKNTNSRTSKMVLDLQDYHMNPVSAAELAKEAQVKKLVFIHIGPPLLNENMEKIYLNGVSDVFDGEVVLGEDRMKFSLEPK